MKWWKDRFPVSITRLRNGTFLFFLLSTRRHKITSESGTRGDGGLCLIGPRAVRPSVCHLTYHYDLSTAASPLSRLSLAAGGQPQNERERGSVVGGQDEHHSRNSHFAAVFKRVVSKCFKEAAQRLAEHQCFHSPAIMAQTEEPQSLKNCFTKVLSKEKPVTTTENSRKIGSRVARLMFISNVFMHSEGTQRPSALLW